MENTNPETSAVTPTPQADSAQPSNTSTPKNSGSSAKMFVGILVLLVVIAAGVAAFLLLNKDDKNSDNDRNDSESEERSSRDDEEEEEAEEEEESEEEEEADSDRDSEDTNREEDEEENSNTEAGVYEGADYSFEYPEEFFLDEEADILFVYRYNPSELEFDQTNDNINFLSQELDFEVNGDNCEEYAELLLGEVGSLYGGTEEMLDSGETEVAGEDACFVEIGGDLSGLELRQTQYVFNVDGMTHFVTVSLSADSENEDAFDDIVDSIELN
jgi:hypothetical protein